MTELTTPPPAQPPEGDKLPPKGPLWRAPGFWIAAFFVLLITMNIIFYWIAGNNPVVFTK